jgi:putative membrane protein
MATKRASAAKTIVSRLLLFSGSILLFSTIAVAGTSSGQAASLQSANPTASTPAPSSANQQMSQPAPAPSIGASPFGPARQFDMSAAVEVPDKDFVSRTVQSGMAEIQLGQLAVQKSSSEDVKEFSRNMVDDHETINNQMEWAAQHMGVRLPSGISKKNKELIAKLQGLSGTEFDNAYIVAMVKDHKNDESEFRERDLQSQNPNLKRLIQVGSPLIKQHLQTIEQIARTHHLMDEKGKLIPAGQE